MSSWWCIMSFCYAKGGGDTTYVSVVRTHAAPRHCIVHVPLVCLQTVFGSASLQDTLDVRDLPACPTA